MAIGNPVTLTSNVASKTISVIATAGQTLFTVTGGYRINQLAVFRNGVRLLDSRDYEARNGATVTLLSAATVGDALEFQVFDDFRVADAIVSAESEQTISGNLTVSGILTATDLRGSDVTFRHVKATGISTVSDTTQATSTTTGAFIVSGGVGIAKSLFVGGDMSVAGTLTYEDVTNTETAGITTTGGLVVTGLGATFGSGVGIADSIYHIDDSNTAIRFPAADTFTVETGGSERIRFTSGPTIGIGDNSPNSGETLVVARSGSTPTIRVNGASSYEAQLKLQADGTATDTQLIAAKTDGSLAFSRWTGSAYAERLRITSAGDVGIGTEAPETPRGNKGLEVAGTTGAEIVATRFDDNITDGDFIGAFLFKNLDAGGTPNHFAGMYAKANGTAGSMDLHFSSDRAQYEADTSDLVIRSGDVGIGTNDPVRKLHLHEDSSNNCLLQFTNTTTGYTSGDGSVIGLDGDESLLISNKESGGMFFHTSNTSRAYFSSGGTFALIGGGSVASPAVSLNGTAGSDSMILDASGRLLLGTSTSRSVGSERNLQIEGTNGANSSISVVRNSNTTGGPSINIGKSRGTSVNTDTVVQNNDTIGTINFRGADGVDLNGVSAAISATVDGTCGSDDTPGRLIFSTTADGANTATERLRIDSVGTFHFKNGMMIENGSIGTTARNGTQNVDLDAGMVRYYSTASTGNWKPNFRVSSSKNVNGLMGTGDVISPTMIVAKGATSHHSDTIQVDGTDVTPEFLGGAPSDGGGSGTFDVYSYTIIKTGDGAFKVFASVSTYE